MKNILLLISICTYSLTVTAQQNKIDSLIEVLKKQKEDTNKVNTLNTLSRELRKKDNANALKYGTEAKEISQTLINNASTAVQKRNLTKYLGRSKVNIAVVQGNIGNYDLALANYHDALNIFDLLVNKRGIADCYGGIGNIYIYQANYEEAIKNLQKSLRIFEELDDKKAIIASYNNIGGAYRREGKYTEALNSYLEGLDISQKIGKKNSGIYLSIGNLYNEQGQYPAALQNYFIALKLYDEEGDRNGTALCYQNIGNVYSEQKNFEDALKNYELARSIFQKLGNKKGLAGTYGNISQAQIEQHNYTEAITADSLSLNLRKEINDKEGIANSYYNIAQIYEASDSLRKAFDNYSMALQIQREINDKRGEAISLNRIGSNFFKQDQNDSAIFYLGQSLSVCKEIGSEEMYRENYRALSAVYEVKNDFERALVNFKQYNDVKDSMFNETKSKQLIEMKTQYETEKKQQQIVILQKDSALAIAKLKQRILESLEQKNEIQLLNQQGRIDSLNIIQARNKLVAQHLKAEADSSQISSLNKDKEIQKQKVNQQKLIKNVFITGFAFALIIAFLFINRFRFKQRAARTLEEKNKIITYQKEKVEKQSEELSQTLIELKQRQQQLVQSEKMASLGVLTAGVAHEINNPINFVQSNILPLRRDVNDLRQLIDQYETTITAKQLKKEFTEVETFRKRNDIDYSMTEIDELIIGIETGAARTAEIVKGLRSFSRLDENILKKANINEGIESTLVLLQNTIQQHNIKVITSLGELPEIECFPGELNQVFMNILTNAIEAINQEGKIFITTKYENKQIKISFLDSGKGIDDRIKEKIFDPFFTTKDVGKGTGLGLSIGYGIIRKHNGKIEVRSTLGKETEFVIILPS